MNLLRIALADLKRVVKDWKAVIWLLVMPFAFAYIFGSAMGSNGPRSIWIPVINLDHHELATIFVDSMKEPGCYIDLKCATNQAELKQKWPYGVVIPPGFGESVLAGKQIKLSLVKGDAPADRMLEVQSRLTSDIVRFTTALIVADTAHRAWSDDTRAALTNALALPPLLAVSQKSHHTLKPPPSGYNQSLPGMLVMFVIQMILTYGGITLVVDRNTGKLLRLTAAPVSVPEIYAGKLLGRILLAMVQAALLLLLGSLFFHIPLGDHPLFLLPIVLCLASVAATASIVAGIICQNEKQVSLLATFTSMIFSSLGGCWWPIEIVPDFFKHLAMFTPSYWAMHGLQSILYFGRSSSVLRYECGVLLAFVAVFAGLAVVAYRVTRRDMGTAKS